jgi:hypothetical protein
LKFVEEVQAKEAAAKLTAPSAAIPPVQPFQLPVNPNPVMPEMSGFVEQKQPRRRRKRNGPAEISPTS